MTELACLSLVIAGKALWNPDPSSRLAGRLTRPAKSNGSDGPGWSTRVLSMIGVLVAIAFVAPRLLVWVAPSLAATLTVGWLVTQSRGERDRRAAADEVVQACQALAAQLRVGDIPARGLARVALDSPLLQPVAATQAIGGDVPAALRSVASRPGCEGLLGLARSWQLCQQTGAPIAQAANRVAEALRSDAAAERLVAAELAGPRATGRMLAGLPVLGLGLGFVGGGNPVDFLTHVLIGQVCLAGAICLVCVGLIWTTVLGGAGHSGDDQ